MNKQLTAKRLLKRHNRHAASDKNWSGTPKTNSSKPKHVLQPHRGDAQLAKSRAKAGS